MGSCSATTTTLPLRLTEGGLLVMSAITDLPVELFFGKIFSYLPVTDILSLGCTNRFLATIVADEPFWHKRIQEDFNFTGSDTARQSGWKFLYRRLSNMALYVWGEKSDSRLGLKKFPKTSVRGGVPFPIRLDIPGVRIVALAAAGMSFHALDSHGNIYVWGVLNGTEYMPSPDDGFSAPSKKADHPMRLELPVEFRSLSCGRLHTTALDAAAQVWTFTSWGRPFRLSASSIDKSSPETTPVQVESGWSFSSILTESGDVLVYWPINGYIEEVIDLKMEDLDYTDDVELKAASMARPSEDEPDVVPCYWWVLQGAELIRLPAIPTGRLPKLECTGLEDDPEESIRLVKIAGLDNNILGLTNKGHVLRYGSLNREDTYQNGCWEYLPFFSDIKQIRTLPAYTRHGENEGPAVTPPETLRITHISASFNTFFAYSTDFSSTVLMGQHISAQQQHRSVISVVVGDYHYGALTSDGKLLTWGKFSKGALGLGDPVDNELGQPGGFAIEEAWRRDPVNADWRLMSPPPEVAKPTEVRFDYEDKRKRRKYCFAAAAAGWHTGALVIDLDPDEEDDNAMLEE
ncbi:RCC1/BLIP-II [Fomes fomentarius]|nr:RCC1/BLIP-II [Fomes fomentarius]